jgi:hypothetical protein
MSKAKISLEDNTLRHIQEMKEQLRQFLGNDGFIFEGNFESAKQEEEFLEHILFMERVGEQPLFDLLEKGGVQLPPSASMDDTQLHAKLWDVINGIALLGCYLSSTDHLSDRQLYEVLGTQILREPTSVCPGNPNASCHIDILGGCSKEDLLIRLKYYADEEERLSCEEEFPDDMVPPHEPLPYDRDRHLPAPASAYSSPREAC